MEQDQGSSHFHLATGNDLAQMHLSEPAVHKLAPDTIGGRLISAQRPGQTRQQDQREDLPQRAPMVIFENLHCATRDPVFVVISGAGADSSREMGPFLVYCPNALTGRSVEAQFGPQMDVCFGSIFPLHDTAQHGGSAADPSGRLRGHTHHPAGQR